MIYILYGLEKILIDREINKIINQSKLNSDSITKYDLEETDLNLILDDAETYSLFDDNKIIIVDNAYIFTGKKGFEQNIDRLERYLNDPNPNTILVFNIIADKLDERKKIVKLTKKIGTIKQLIVKDVSTFVKTLFEPYEISSQNIELLIKRVGNNSDILNNEISKIKIYKDDDKKITTDDILALTNQIIDTDIFKFIDNIIINNKSLVFETYNELIKIGEEPIKIIVMLANQFRLMYQVKGLTRKGYSEKDIAKILDIHPYRVKLALGKSKNFSDDKLLSILNQLANLDEQIKKGEIDKYLGLELFILNI